MIPFFGKKKEEKKKEEVPAWFMWMMGLFIAYAVISNLLSDKTIEVRKNTAGEEVIISDGKWGDAPIDVMNMLEAGSSRRHVRSLATESLREGSGSHAINCWETAVVRYALYNDKNEKLKDNLSEGEPPFKFAIGRAEVIPGLERGVLGMRKGEVRDIAIRPELAYGYPGFHHESIGQHDIIAYRVELMGIKRPDNLPISDLGLRVYDDEIGQGRPAQCTEYVFVRVKGWALDGSALWGGPKVVLMRIGAGEVPYAIERSLAGMRAGGKRTVIAPPGYMKPLFGYEEVLKADEQDKMVSDVTAEAMEEVMDTMPEPMETAEDTKAEEAPKVNAEEISIDVTTEESATDEVAASAVEAETLKDEEAEKRQSAAELLAEVIAEEDEKKRSRFNFPVEEGQIMLLEIELFEEKPDYMLSE